jgi:hypothetical protein
MSVIVVSGALANKPCNGGNAWSRLSWVQGWQRLGFEVYFVEQIAPSDCLDANGAVTSFEGSVNLAYFREVMEQFGLGASSSLIYGNGLKVHGVALSELRTVAQRASLLFNFSGHLAHPDLMAGFRCRLYYDDDPGFTQFWHAAGQLPAIEAHDFHFTIGENLGQPDCLIPAGNINWRHTRPPVVLEEWTSCGTRSFDRFTTIASWRGAFAPVEHGGKRYGVKAHEFRKYFELPQRSRRRFSIALQIHADDGRDLNALIAQGWEITDPKRVADSPDAFRQFVQSSAAEFSVAQGIYVDTHSGWFSDRTVRYLASGKPALVQDTGFTRNYPTGRGLLAFRNLEEAIEGAERVVCDYDQHGRAARRVAEEHFDSNTVVSKVAKEIGLALPR